MSFSQHFKDSPNIFPAWIFPVANSSRPDFPLVLGGRGQAPGSIASYVGHHSLLAYFAVAENEPIARVRFRLLEKMKQPCGKPPVAQEEEEQ